MSYSIQVVKRTQQNTTNWSGGTTTQIAIYPPNSEYAKRNFTWRLSSATVNLEESTFTSLPGISRVLMVVDGTMQLEHQGHYSVELKAFEQDSFSGDWITNSCGKVQDFNLMMSQDCIGELRVVPLGQKEKITVSDLTSMDCDQFTMAFYCVDGSVQFVVNGATAYELQEGDVLLIHKGHGNEKIILAISNLEEKNVHVIRGDMQY